MSTRAPARPKALEAPVPEPLRRRHVWRYVACAIGVWLAACVVMLALAAVAARHAKDEATALRERPLAELAMSDASKTTAAITRARDDFARASRLASSPVLLPIRVLPVVGWQVSSVQHMADGSATALEAVRTALDRVRATLDRYDLGNGRQRVEMLNDLSKTAGWFADRLDELDLGRSSLLLPALHSAHAQAADELAKIRSTASDAASGAAALAKLLTGPNHYVLFAANNAEMRAGAGAPLRAGLLSTADGRFSMTPTAETSALHLAGDGVAIPDQLSALWGWAHPGREWRNLGLSPRFPVTGALASQMWTSFTGHDVDGVISVDTQALAEILKVTGGVSAGGERITSSNVVQLLTHDQYTKEYGQRVGALGDVMSAAFHALDAGRWDPLTLARAMGRASSGRHILVWSKDDALQRMWHDAGVDGELGPRDVALSVVNRGGNKLDRFLDVSSNMTTRTIRDGVVVHLTVTLHNRVPTGEPTYIAGPHPGSGVGEGVYLGVATLHVPADVASLAMRGTPVTVSGRDGASRVMGGVVQIPRGGTKILRFSFTLPDSVDAVRLLASARIPATRWTTPHGDLTDADTATIALP